MGLIVDKTLMLLLTRLDFSLARASTESAGSVAQCGGLLKETLMHELPKDDGYSP